MRLNVFNIYVHIVTSSPLSVSPLEKRFLIYHHDGKFRILILGYSLRMSSPLMLSEEISDISIFVWWNYSLCVHA